MLEEHLSVNNIAPVLFDDGFGYFLTDRSARELGSIYRQSGKTKARASGTPTQVAKVAPGRAGDEVFLHRSEQRGVQGRREQRQLLLPVTTTTFAGL